MGRFEGKVAIVTGAAGGIGSGCALRLAQEGCKVVLTDIKDSVFDFVDSIKKQLPDCECMGFVCNLANSDEVDNLVEVTVKEYGRLDIMFNNAGVNHAMCAVEDFENKDFKRVMDANVWGPFNGCRAAIKQMIKQGDGGHIVNTASYYAKRGYGYFAPYCGSKAFLVNFTRSFALEAIKHGVYVNCICPGDLDTEMHLQSLREEAVIKNIPYEEVLSDNLKDIPCGRLGTYDDIANALMYLCSDECTYTIGEPMNVSGGREMC
jgi:NAD(P)-dependent dehydrogenase (short-subunit alcohol dehydrogenase family)